jgi:hypothetical protein
MATEMPEEEFQQLFKEIEDSINNMPFHEASGKLRRLFRTTNILKEGSRITQSSVIGAWAAANFAAIRQENETFEMLRKQAADEEHIQRILGEKRMGTYKVY